MAIDENERKYLRHLTSDSLWNRDLQREPGQSKMVLGTTEIMRRYGQRLICPKCERGAFRCGSKNTARCNKCGWFGRSITIDEYLTEKLWR